MVITLTHQVHRAICNCPKYMYVYVIEGFTLLYFQKMSEIILEKLLTRGVTIYRVTIYPNTQICIMDSVICIVYITKQTCGLKISQGLQKL